MDKDLNRHSSNEDVQMTNRYMKHAWSHESSGNTKQNYELSPHMGYQLNKI